MLYIFNEKIKGVDMAKKEKAQKYKTKKGCWRRSWLGLCIIVFVLIFCIVGVADMFSGSGNWQRYTTLLEELDVNITDEQMSDNLITDQEIADFEAKFSSTVSTKNGEPIFDEMHSFIYQNAVYDNLIYNQSSLQLSVRDLTCFLNSALQAGWIDDLYEDGENLMSILEFVSLNTENQETSVNVIAKIKLGALADDIEDAELADFFAELPDFIYIDYQATFNNQTYEVLSSSMWFNKLTEDSNDLLLEILFDNNNEGGNAVQTALNSIMVSMLDDFNLLLADWRLSAQFLENELILSA